MKSIIRSAIIGATALSTALIVTPLGPAIADGIGVSDPEDLGHGVDLRSVAVDHDAKVVVTTTHTNLRKTFRSGSGGAVFIDADPGDKGPEYVFVGGFFVGTDYTLLHTEGFADRQWGRPAHGSYRMTVDYDRDQVRIQISHEALGSPEQVRVAVRVAGTRRDGSITGRDWLGDARSFTEWVAAD